MVQTTPRGPAAQVPEVVAGRDLRPLPWRGPDGIVESMTEITADPLRRWWPTGCRGGAAGRCPVLATVGLRLAGRSFFPAAAPPAPGGFVLSVPPATRRRQGRRS